VVSTGFEITSAAGRQTPGVALTAGSSAGTTAGPFPQMFQKMSMR